MSKPPTLTVPDVGGINPVIIRIEVDFPAPFGPRKPSTSPRSTENDTPSTARLGPNVLIKFSTLIMFNPVKSQRLDLANPEVFVKLFLQIPARAAPKPVPF